LAINLKRFAISLTRYKVSVYNLIIFDKRSRMTEKKKPDMMTVAQIAELFSVNVNSVHDWIAAGKFPGAFKISKARTAAYLVPTEEVLAFKKERDQAKNA
jgi:hypothetical protein